MSIELINVIISGAIGLIGALGGGGLVYWKATRKQKDAEASKSTTEARLAEANYAEQILEKFQKIVLERMDSGDSVRKQELDALRSDLGGQLSNIQVENRQQNETIAEQTVLLRDVVEYLNGGFQAFESKKQKKTGKSKK